MEKKMENEMETEGIQGFKGLGLRVPRLAEHRTIVRVEVTVALQTRRSPTCVACKLKEATDGGFPKLGVPQ